MSSGLTIACCLMAAGTLWMKCVRTDTGLAHDVDCRIVYSKDFSPDRHEAIR